jgi:hypothetical protein
MLDLVTCGEMGASVDTDTINAHQNTAWQKQLGDKCPQLSLKKSLGVANTCVYACGEAQ